MRLNQAGLRRVVAILCFVLTMAAGMPVLAEETYDKHPADARPIVAMERRPYRIQLLVAFDVNSLDPTAVQTLFREIDQTSWRCIGEMWSLKSTEVSWPSPMTARGLARIDRSELSAHHAMETADVWFLAVVQTRPAGWRVSIRSWQPEIETETLTISNDVSDLRDLAMTMLQMCRDLVRPMGIVEQVNDRSVRVRLRAGELAPTDPSFAQLVPGDLLMPMLAFRNKDKVIEKLQALPWTYITVDEVQASSVQGTVQSGLKLALGGKKRGRIDTLVVALRPQHASTQLELFTQTKPQLPLVAHRIEIRTQSAIPRPTEANPAIDPGATLLGEKLTDRRGTSHISIEPTHRLVWLFAYSGQHLLARVPFVPGIVARSRLEVPDDATRLATEADLQMLQGEVVDAVALRNTAMSAIRSALKKDDFATIDQKLEILKQQQSASTLIERLVSVRVEGLAAAKARKDKAAEVRISRMCDDATTLINAHLGEEKLRLLIEEVDALRPHPGKSSE